MPDLCLNEPVLIPSSVFSSPGTSLIEGVIPWVFGKGGFSSSISSRVKPKLAYVSPSLILLEYPSYSYENLGCVISSPRIQVVITGYCCKGMFFLHITCRKGHKVATVWYRGVPALDKLVADPLLSDGCNRKFAAKDTPLELSLLALSNWVRVMINNSTNRLGPGHGSSGWAEGFITAASGGGVRVCDNDCYTIVRGETVITDVLWSDVIDNYALLNSGIVPFEKSTNGTLVKYVDNDNSIGVVDTTTRAVKLFNKVRLNCEGDYIVYETNGFFKEECFEEPDEEETPADNDPRWRKFCAEGESCASRLIAYWLPVNSFDNLSYLPIPGRYELPPGGRIPLEPTQYYWDDVVETYPDTSKLYQVTRRVDVFEEQVTTVVKATDEGCVTSKYTVIVHAFSKKFTSDYVPSFGGGSMAAAAAEEARKGLPTPSLITLVRDLSEDKTPRQCGDPINLDGPKMDNVPDIDRERDDPCPGKCYLKGTLSIDILFFCRPLRLFLERLKADALSEAISFVRSLNPGFSDRTITKQNIDLGKDRMKPDGGKKMQLEIGIPFTICLDSGEQTVGGFTVGIEDNIVFAMYKGRRFEFDINNILAAYNAAEWLIDSVNPLPVGITDLEVICEEGDLK